MCIRDRVGGLNVSYGDIPPRRTTLRLHQPIGKAEVLPLLKSVAATNGLQVIRDERRLRLQVDDPRTQIPAAKAVVMPESRLCLLYTSPSPRDRQKSRMPSS